MLSCLRPTLKLPMFYPSKFFLSTGNDDDFDYHEVKKNFQWNCPDKFNFAQDVIDVKAEGDEGQNLAFFHVSGLSEKVTKWNFSQLSQKSKVLASSLSRVGDLKRAITILPRIPEWWLLNLSTMRTGTILMPGTILLTAEDIIKRIEKGNADSIIGDLSVAKKLDQIVTRKEWLKYKILVAKEGDDESDLSYFKDKGWTLLTEVMEANGNETIGPRSTDSSEVMQIFFTSGTTGEPKLVPHTQLSYGYCHFVTGKYWLGLDSTDLHWSVSDTGWAKAAWSNVFSPWHLGAAVFIHGMDRFVARDVLETLNRYPITTLCAPPTLYRAMVQEDLSKYSGDKLRHCVSAGEPLNEEVIWSWEASTGLLIHEGYGQTETTLVAGTFKGMEVRPGSIGKPAPGFDVRIVNSIGREVPRKTQGNIGIKLKPERPPGLFQNYISDSSTDADQGVCFINDEMYLTGDRATMDEDGYIWFDARDDDIIISAGYRIGPFEVESALLEHPAVAESAVVASPDVVRGQVVKAFVVPSKPFVKSVKDENLAAKLIEELQNFVKKKTAPYKYPRKITFVESLPKTVSGKIRRAELRQRELQLK